MIKSKKSTKDKELYLSILNTFKETTNLTKIKKRFKISKQNLNNYIRDLKINGYLIKKGRGWYEVNRSKDLTKYDKLLGKDFTRGHAYIWNIKLPKEIKDWDKRIEILKSKGINFNLVGALKTTPRIKVLGRKVWLCNNHLRIFDKKGNSYYGKDAIESKKSAFNEVLLIVEALSNKLGIVIRPEHIYFQKEHYALIKNDLAIEHNRKGEIVHISDEFGEWLLIDDSLGEGGELENVGKKAFVTNIPMQKWWNDQKKHNFELTPTKTLEIINGMLQTQQMNADNIIKHQKVLDGILEEQKADRKIKEETLKALKAIQKSLIKKRKR